MSEKQEKEKRRQELLDRAIAAAEAREEAEKNKVEIQTYYFVDTKGNRYEVEKEIYLGLTDYISGRLGKSLETVEFGFVNHYQEKEKWAKITFPLDSVWYVLTVFEKFAPINQQDEKLIEEGK